MEPYAAYRWWELLLARVLGTNKLQYIMARHTLVMGLVCAAYSYCKAVECLRHWCESRGEGEG